MALLSRPPSAWYRCRTGYDGSGAALILVFSALLQLLLVPLGRAQAEGPTESQVKAAFVYNFAKFVEWPADALGNPAVSLKFCVLGETPIGVDLGRITQGKAISGHSIQVLQNPRTLHDCHVLFISSSHSASVKELREALRTTPVLTIGESRDFAAQGGMIGFLIEDARVRFEINLQAAKQMRLQISSKLLSLAKRVIT